MSETETKTYTVTYLPPACNIDTALTLLINKAIEAGQYEAAGNHRVYYDTVMVIDGIRAELRAMIQTKDDAI